MKKTLLSVFPTPDSWCQGTGARFDAQRNICSRCLSQAMMHIDSCTLRDYDLLRTAIDSVFPATIRRKGGIPGWNDAPERTFDQIQAVAAEYDRLVASS